MAAADDIRAREAISAAAAKTREARGARILLSRGARDLDGLPGAPRFGSVGVASFALNKLSDWMAKNSARARDAEGVLDLQERRYMVDFGYYAVLQTDGKEWSGRSGRSLSTLPAREPAESFPLWLLQLLVVLRSAAETEHQEVRGTECRHYLASVDAGHAWTVLPDRLLEDRRDLPIEVWIDDTHVRRIQICGGQRTQTLELWDFGTPVDALDWTRLPTFRSPE